MHGLREWSLTARLHGHCHLPCCATEVITLAWPWEHLKVGNHTNILQMDKFMISKRGLNLAHWYTIYSQAYPV